MLDIHKDYWFTVEPYVYITFSCDSCLLYNTLDGVTIEVSQVKIIQLLQSLSAGQNCGTTSFSGKLLLDDDFYDFIVKLRSKFMGDVIDVSLSSGQPVQLLPILNLQNDVNKLQRESYRSVGEFVMQYLFEVTIDFGQTINRQEKSILEENFCTFFNTIANVKIINLIDIWSYPDLEELIAVLQITHSIKNINCSYEKITANNLLKIHKDKFSFSIIVDFPLDNEKLENTWKILFEDNWTSEIIFEVTCEENCAQVDDIINKYKIVNYQIRPKFTGKNLSFFEENLFLSKKDILEETLSLREIFAHQALNTFDFGKITVLGNGDVYANPKFPPLGNIATHSIQEMLYKEMNEGHSWLRIRNQAPCSDCIYQWLCPSPSDYEIVIGKPNLCHIKP